MRRTGPGVERWMLTKLFPQKVGPYPVLLQSAHGWASALLQVVELWLCDFPLCNHLVAHLHSVVSVCFGRHDLKQHPVRLVHLKFSTSGWLGRLMFQTPEVYQDGSRGYRVILCCADHAQAGGCTCVTMLPSSRASTVAGRHSPSGVKIDVMPAFVAHTPMPAGAARASIQQCLLPWRDGCAGLAESVCD